MMTLWCMWQLFLKWVFSESPERLMRNVFTLFLSLFALVVHVTMAILKIAFIHVHAEIHEDMRMRPNCQRWHHCLHNASCVSMCVRVHTWKICHRTGTDTANQRRLPLRRQWPCRDRSSRRAFARAMPRLYWRARKAPRTALLGHHHHLLERGRGNRHRKLTKNRKTHPRHGDTNTYFVCTQLQVLKEKEKIKTGEHRQKKTGGKAGCIRMIKKKLHLSWKAQGGRGSLWEFKWEKEKSI